MYEAQIAQLTQQSFNIESTALATENLRNTMVTLDAMSQANKELRKQYGKIDIGKIEVRPFRGADGHRHPTSGPDADRRVAIFVEYAVRHGGAFGAVERSPGIA